MNKLSFVVAFVALIVMSSASAGGSSQREHDVWFDRIGDDGIDYLFYEEMPSEKSSFSAMETGKSKSVDSVYIELVDDDPEEGDAFL
jgi:hypothetical protein